MQIKLSNGFKVDINKEVLKDWRFIQSVSYSESGNDINRVKGVVDLADLLLGSSKDALIEKIASENDGAVPIDKMSQCISEIILKLKEDNETKK